MSAPLDPLPHRPERSAAAAAGRLLPGLLLPSLLCLALTLPGATAAAAGLAAEGSWRLGGPEGGTVRHLARAPGRPEVVFAVAPFGGLHRSTDGGRSWRSLLDRLPLPDPGAVATGPRGERVLAYSGATLHRSADGGDTWSALERNLGFSDHLRIAPSDADVVYATGSSGTRRSLDGGDTWSVVTPDWGALLPPAQHALRRLAVDPGDPLRVWGVDPSGGAVLRSDDGGGSWRVVLETPAPRDVALHPTEPAHVAVAAAGGVWTSDDGGTTWRVRSEGVPFRDYQRVEAVPEDPGGWRAISRTLLDSPSPPSYSIRRVGGPGEPWQVEHTGLEILWELSAGAGQPWLVATSTTGVRREAGAASWPPSVAGLHGQLGLRLASLAGQPSRLLATAGGPARLFRSGDGGATWSDGTLLEGSSPLFIHRVLAPAAGLPYVLTDDGVVLLRGDQVELVEAVPGARHLDLAVHPAAPRRCFAVTRLALPTPQVSFLSQLHRSTDGGHTWEALELAPPPSPRLHAVAVDPADPDRVFVASADRESSRLYASEDGGDTWAVRGEGEAGLLLGLAAQPAAGGPRLVGFAHRHVAVSDDGGHRWRTVDAGLPEGVEPTAVAASPRPGGPVVVGTRFHGVFALGDGDAWHPLGGDLPPLEVADLEVVPGAGVVLATLRPGGGVYRFGVEDGCDPADPAVLCAGAGDRFRVAVDWDLAVDGEPAGGRGTARELTPEAGWFWFFADDNAEVAVKVLDGRPVNGDWWVFYASLSNVGFDLAVTDTASGAFRVYRNPPGRLASRGDTAAFDGDLPVAAPFRSPAGTSPTGDDGTPRALPPAFVLSLPDDLGTACGGAPADLCLQGDRFRVEATWTDFQGGTGTATGIPVADDSGYLWFFRPENLELFVKVLDGRPVNGHWWVFYGSLSNVAFELTVTDTLTGQHRTYVNPAGTFASAADTAF